MSPDRRLPLHALHPGDMPPPGLFKVHSIFLTIQGEGSNAGKLSLFTRLAGCQMWTGLEEDRRQGLAPCASICDTQFTGGDFWNASELAAHIELALDTALPGYVENNQGRGKRRWRPDVLVVFTGGEPLLQLATPQGKELLGSLNERMGGKGFLTRLCLETNGSVPVPFPLTQQDGGPFHHVVLSPKTYDPPDPSAGVPWRASEFKVLYPLYNPKRMASAWNAYVNRDGAKSRTRLWVQPVDLPSRGGQAHFAPEAFQFVVKNPAWRVSAQAHKHLNLL